MTDGATERKAVRGQFVLSTSRDEIDEAQSRLLEMLERCGYEHAACFAVRTAVEEALSNAIQHGNGNDPAKKVTIEFTADPELVVIDVEDEGRGFDPGSVPDPTRPENVDIPSGRGIMLMRVYMSSVEYAAAGNRVRMVYERGRGPGVGG